MTLAAMPDDLYRGQTIVTGQGETNRLAGFAICLEDVLIKVSGALQVMPGSRVQAAISSKTGCMTPVCTPRRLRCGGLGLGHILLRA